MEPAQITLAISVLGFLASVYYSNRNAKKADMSEAVQRAEDNARIATKLDNIAADVRDTSKNVDRLREDLAEHGSRISAVEQSAKSAHHRIDELIKLHNRYCGVDNPYREEWRHGHAGQGKD
jgi:outer membrane murein-binding lipoprotein Lpp